MFIENSMFEIDSKLMFYHRSLSRLKRHLAVVSQLHRAPRLFCTAVHEIVRRRKFSQAFLSVSNESYNFLYFSAVICADLMICAGGSKRSSKDMRFPFANDGMLFPILPRSRKQIHLAVQ